VSKQQTKLAEWLRQKKADLGLTWAGMAAATGIPEKSLYSVLAGDRFPTRLMQRAMFAKLCTPEDERALEVALAMSRNLVKLDMRSADDLQRELVCLAEIALNGGCDSASMKSAITALKGSKPS